MKRHRDVVAEGQVVEDADHEVEDHEGDVRSQGNGGSEFPEFRRHREPLDGDEQEGGKGQKVDAAGVNPGS